MQAIASNLRYDLVLHASQPIVTEALSNRDRLAAGMTPRRWPPSVHLDPVTGTKLNPRTTAYVWARRRNESIFLGRRTASAVTHHVAEAG